MQLEEFYGNRREYVLVGSDDDIHVVDGFRRTPQAACRAIHHRRLLCGVEGRKKRR